MNQQELLLRDIHLPPPVSWWPPAPGWWLLAAALCGFIALAWWWRRRALRLRNAPAALAHRELERLQSAWSKHGDAQQLLREISIWLRRVSMSLTTRREAASLTGVQWQQYLAELAGEAIFTDTETRLISAASYQPALSKSETDALARSIDGERLIALCQRWLDASARRVKHR